MNITTRKHGYDAYMFFRRRKLYHVNEIIAQINGKTIKEAASTLDVDVTTLLIFIGHLKRIGFVKEVIIN